MTRGFFAIGIDHGKTAVNLGTLWRSAFLYKAAFIFTVGRRYSKDRDAGAADTVKAYRSVPLFNFADHNDLLAHLPYSCPLIGVELDPSASSISAFRHPERACYVLGAEDNGLTPEVMKACHKLVQLPGEFSMNVSNAGTVVMYDRWLKQEMRAA
jgi:tRNA G18 (ribose-2'-O)-methylase SpoU